MDNTTKDRIITENNGLRISWVVQRIKSETASFKVRMYISGKNKKCIFK